MPPPKFARFRDNWTSHPRARGVAGGAALGLLAGYLLVEFGLPDIMSAPPDVVLIPATLLGAAVGAIGLVWALAVVDAMLIAAFFVIADTPIMGRVADRWVRSDPIPARVDAIVVLSAAVNSDGRLNTAGLQRLLTALELYQRGIAPRIFTTAVESQFGRLVRSSTADQERLIRLGGARDAWTSLTGVYNTRDEAMQASAQLPPGAHTVAVVTSPMHTRRACATFEGVGFTVVCVPSREHDYVTWHPLHSSDRLASFRDYLYERLGMVKYRAKGWVKQG